MLRYQWNNNNHSFPPSNLILSDIDLHHHHHNHHHNHNHNYNNNNNHNHDFSTPSSHHPDHRPIFDDSFPLPCTFPHDNNPQQIPLFSDPPAFSTAGSSSLLTLESLSSVMHIPKTEPDLFTNRPIGLNLGRRTYFSADDDLVSRLYRRSRAVEPALHSPKCQAEGCNADLSHAKHYHRRHKVCEFHSKASTVIAAGLTQRFCQQCSRFHLLSEFDNGKRSCRKRLADHNRRRRKSNNQRITTTAPSMSSGENAQTSPSQNVIRSPSDSGINSSSSVTIAVSPPRVSFDSSFVQRSYE